MTDTSGIASVSHVEARPFLAETKRALKVDILNRLSKRWSEYTLSTRFIVVGVILITVTMAAIGTWVDSRIRESVVRNASAVSALYMESLITGPVQELAHSDKLSAATKLAISDLIEDTVLGLTVMEIKVWRTDGTVVYSSDPRDMDTRPPLTRELSSALAGKVTADFNDQEDRESAPQRIYGRPIFEVYAPMYEKGTNRIIGAAEIYEDATHLVRDFTIARQQSWLVVGSLTALMMCFLFALVIRSSHLLVHQKRSLEAKYLEQTRLLEQNALLRVKVASTHKQYAALLEQQLRRVGADLHDGPAQLLALALLRLDDLATIRKSAKGGSTPDAIRAAMDKAMEDIRNISAGLSVPDLEQLSPEMVISRAVADHRRLTKTAVKLRFGSLPEDLPLSTKTCLYRCIQEGLSNAYRHAGGMGQAVTAAGRAGNIVLTISDTGPGFDKGSHPGGGRSLGISGMRHRVEALEGTFTMRSEPGRGTEISVIIPGVVVHA